MVRSKMRRKGIDVAKRKKIIAQKPKDYTKKSLFASLALHALLLLGIGFAGGTASERASNSKGHEQADQEDVGKILDKPQDQTVEVDLVPPPEKVAEAPKQPEPKKEEKKCTGFGGIGIEYSGKNGLVGRVYDGYPASKAGIQAGDYIVSSIFAIRGEPGTEITVTILRNGQTYEVTMTRELICTDKQMRSEP